MEATPQRPTAAGDPTAPDAACLAALVERWTDAGAAVPVAIVVSVFDDVLPSLSEPTENPGADLDAIVVGDDGIACLRKPVGLASASKLLVRALGDDVPSAARPFVSRLLDDDEGPIDGEQLRQWMRDALGAPASREEVRAAFAALDDSEAETLLPEPAVVDDEESETLPPAVSSALPVPPLVSESEEAEDPAIIGGEAPLPPERPHDTKVDGPRAFDNAETDAGTAAEPKSELESEVEVAEPPTKETAMPSDAYAASPSDADSVPSTIVQPTPKASMGNAGSDSDGRKVVRHTYNPKTVSVNTAPAARRSARAAAMGPDSILVPNDRRRGYGWFVVLAGIGAVIYLLFFR